MPFSRLVKSAERERSTCLLVCFVAVVEKRTLEVHLEGWSRESPSDNQEKEIGVERVQ
jgi:hypothetical protein